MAYINRTRFYRADHPAKFLDDLHYWSQKGKSDNFSILLQTAQSEGFAFKPGNQFRLTITAPVPKDAENPVLDSPDDDVGKALLSYHGVRKWNMPRKYRGCESCASCSGHLGIMFRKVRKNQDFTRPGALRTLAGFDSPGIERCLKECREDEIKAFRDLYHRCSVFFLTRTRFSLIFSADEKTRDEDHESFDFDNPLFILGHRQSFVDELSIPRANTFKIDIDDPQFTTFVNGELRPRPRTETVSGVKFQVVPERDEVNELIMHQNLLAIQVVQALATYSPSMILMKTFTAAWQTLTQKPSDSLVPGFESSDLLRIYKPYNSKSSQTYVRTDSLIVMIFEDEHDQESVMVLHGAHSLDGKDLEVEPLDSQDFESREGINI